MPALEACTAQPVSIHHAFATPCSRAALALLALCASALQAQQLEVSWAHTVQGITNASPDYIHGAGDCAVDPWGNLAIISGGGTSTTIMQGPGAPLNIPLAGASSNIFLGRYHADGTPAWGFWVGGAGYEAPVGVAADALGNIYVAAKFDGTFDMDPGPDSALISSGDGDRDQLIIRYDSSGNFLGATHLVADYVNPTCGHAYRMGFDAANNLYVAGFFRHQIDLDGGPGEVLLTGNDDFQCGYVAKYDPQGNLLQHLALPAVDYSSYAHDLVVKPDGSFFVVGMYSDSIDMDPGPAEYILDGPTTACFAASYAADFSLQWARGFEGGFNNSTHIACAGANGGLIISGEFSGLTTIQLLDGSTVSLNGGNNGSTLFISALDATGNYLWFRALTGDDTNGIYSMAAKDDGTFYATFYYAGDFNFDPGVSDFTVTTSGFPNYDMGLARYNMADGSFIMGHGFTGGGTVNYDDVELLGTAMYLTGMYSGNLHPDIPAGTDLLTPGGMAVIKYCHVPDNLTWSTGDSLLLCPGSDTSIVASGAEQFLWYDTLVGGAPIASGNTIQLLDVDLSSIVYLEGINGVCVSQRIPITLVLRPQVEISVDSLTICEGDTVLLSYTGLADTYAPNIPQAFTTGYAPVADQAIWVLATDLTEGCTAVDTAFIHVLDAPDVTLELAPDSICLFGTSVQLSGGSPAGGTWDGEGVVNDDMWSPFESGPGEFPVTYTVVGGNDCSATATDFMIVAVCWIGFEETASAPTVQFHPVPARDHLFLRRNDTGKAEVRVLSLDGRLLLRNQVNGQIADIDISSLAPGSYLLSVPCGEGMFCERFVKD